MNNPQEAPLLSQTPQNDLIEGILLVNKARGESSFNLVARLRKTTQVKKIGHAGTLDPFATGVMILLIGKKYTRLSEQFLSTEKEYETLIKLGTTTDTFDCEGNIVSHSDKIPTLAEVKETLTHFQNELWQIPPMFSAKKIGGKKLYTLARQGITIEREPVKVFVKTRLLSFDYPFLRLNIVSSKGTYIRSIGHEIGIALGSGAHLIELTRIRSGNFPLTACIDSAHLNNLPVIRQALHGMKKKE